MLFDLLGEINYLQSIHGALTSDYKKLAEMENTVNRLPAMNDTGSEWKYEIAKIIQDLNQWSNCIRPKIIVIILYITMTLF